MKEIVALDQQEMEHRYKLLHYKVQSRRLADTWIKFQGAGFEPILIKGWAAAQLYPEPFERQYTDVDLVISPESYYLAEAFLQKTVVDVPVDLHKGTRHLDSLSFDDLYKNSVLKMCEEVPVRILREEDHLRVLCIHWLNDGGADKDRLWDIYHGVNNRSETFDWDRLLGTVSQKRRRWIICAIGLAERFLGLELDRTPIGSEARNLPRWLIKAVEKEWQSGVRLIPLQQVLYDKKQFWQQVRKRIPPNPVQATIEVEGSFDKVPRFIYQIKDVFLRLPASLEKYWKGKSWRFKRKIRVDG